MKFMLKLLCRLNCGLLVVGCWLWNVNLGMRDVNCRRTLQFYEEETNYSLVLRAISCVGEVVEEARGNTKCMTHYRFRRRGKMLNKEELEGGKE